MLQTITSKDNEKLKAAAKLVQSKKERMERKEFLTEGYRLCMDAFQSGKKPKRIFVTEQLLKKENCEAILADCRETYLISAQLAQKLSDTQTPQGIFCVFSMPDNQDEIAKKVLKQTQKRRIIVLSSLQDPGNIGTIIRSCEAFGVDLIVMSSDCPDLYSPKMLRATMGGVFRMPVLVTDCLKEEILSMKQNGIAVYAAALRKDAVPIVELPLDRSSAVVIGNEANGLTEEIIEACSKAMIIPMQGRAESLNAATAASIAAWEMSRAQYTYKAD